MSFADILTRTAERNALINRNIIADNGCFADNRARAVVYKKSSSDLCAGVDFDSRSAHTSLRNHSCDKEQIVVIKPVRLSVASDRLISGVEQHNLNCRGCRRVTLPEAFYIFFYSFKQ